MGCRFLYATDEHYITGYVVVFHDSVTGWAFGPVMPNDAVAEGFSRFLRKDPRDYTQVQLQGEWDRFCKTIDPFNNGIDEVDPDDINRRVQEYRTLTEETP